MAQLNPINIVAVVFMFAVYLLRKAIVEKRRLPLPPGPEPLPFVGNILDLPAKGGQDWEHWYKHKDLYGPVSSITVFGQVMIFINDLDKALELLDKRGARYSERAKMVFAGEICGYNERMPFFPYNQAFRQQRKLAGSQIGTRQAVSRFYSAIDTEVRRFLSRTMEKPTEIMNNLENESGSLMLNILYGYKPSSYGSDPLVALINKVMAEFSQAVVVGAWIVDLIPWLRFLPAWLPGMGFKQLGRQWKADSDRVMNIPADFAKDQLARKVARPSYVERLLRMNPDAEDEKHIRQSAMALYSGGADSTAAGLNFFYLAMTAFPEVQRKAQEEIDRTIGAGRLPSFQDRENLPYVEAVVKEVLRWRPLAPLGPPHVADQDDEFEGFRIPKGAMIMPNIKGFSIDPLLYDRPEKFDPDRFLTPNEARSPHTYVFGFGRRICPGRLLADSNMFLAIAQSLAVFHISKEVDEKSGKPLEPNTGTTAGLVAHPLPFRCGIAPRSKKHAELVRLFEVEHPTEEGDSKFLRGLHYQSK